MTKEIVDNYTGQTLTNPNNVSPITWTSSNEAVATVEDGTVTVLAVGETTIKASFAGDEAYKKAEVSYTLTVQDSRQAIDLSFAETSVNVNITETVDAPRPHSAKRPFADQTRLGEVRRRFCAVCR